LVENDEESQEFSANTVPEAGRALTLHCGRSRDGGNGPDRSAHVRQRCIKNESVIGSA